MPAMTARRVYVACLSLAIAASGSCASYQNPEVNPSDVINRQRDVILRDEIMASPHRLVDLFQAVRGLRPHFLQTPSGSRTRPNAALLYIDGVRQPYGLQTLASIPASAAERVEYLDPVKAESQYGSTATGGAVLVILTGQRRTPASARDTSDVQ